MLRKIALLAGLLFGLGASSLAQNVPSTSPLTQQNVAPQDSWSRFTALTATGQTSAIPVFGNLVQNPAGTNPGQVALYTPKFVAVQATVVGSPSACTYHVFATLYLPSENPTFPNNYSDISGSKDCTTAAGLLTFLTYVPATQIVIQLNGLSGGTSPSVQFRLLVAH